VSANTEIDCALSSFPIAVPARKYEFEVIVQISMWRLFGVHIYLKAVKGFYKAPQKKHVEHRHFYDHNEFYEVPTRNVQSIVHPPLKILRLEISTEFGMRTT